MILTISEFFVLFIICCYYFWSNYRKRHPNFPPGPPRLPVWGSYWFLLWENYTFAHKGLLSFRKRYKSDIVGLYLGDYPTVVTFSHKLCKELLTRDEFNGRNDTIITRTRALGGRLGLFFIDGPYWKEQRRFSLRHMRDYGFGRRSLAVENLVTEEITYLMDLFTREPQDGERDICRKKGQILFPDILYGLFLNAILLMLSSTRFDRHQLRELGRAGLRFQRSGDVTGNAISITPWLKHFAPDFFGYTSAVKDNGMLLDFLKKIIDEHKRTYSSEHKRDFIDDYIEEMTQIEKIDPQESSSFSENQLLLTVLDLMFPAAIACGHTMNFYFAYLLNYPEVQEKIGKEIDEVVGKTRLPTLDDRKSLPYTEASIREVIRINPINPLGIPRRCMVDCELDGYFIPKDTIMLPCVFSAHMDESVWKEPEVFRPERWLDDNGQLLKKDQTIGFGAGKRLCAGETFSRQNMFLVVSCLLQNFTFSSIPEGNPPDLSKQLAGINVSVPDYWVQVKPR